MVTILADWVRTIVNIFVDASADCRRMGDQPMPGPTCNSGLKIAKALG